jgi:hypothetical protein
MSRPGDRSRPGLGGALLARVVARLPRPWQVAVHNARTLTEAYGQAATVKSSSAVDAQGAPIPWYTYPAIEYLSSFDLCRRRVFEYGSGQSSAFWAARAETVISVEHDPAWFEQVRARAPANHQVLLKTDIDEYVAAIETPGTSFDLIAVDGRARTRCADIVPRFLAEQGLVVFDNTDWYPRAAARLRAAGLFQVDFNGFGPINNYTWTTSVFLRAGTALQEGYRDPKPIGGIEGDGDSHD